MIVIRYNKKIVMKKICLFLFICFCIASAKAQDTVKCNDHYYLINHPVPPLMSSNHIENGTDIIYSYWQGGPVFNCMQEYYSEAPVTVYGVAITGKQSYNNLRVMLFDQIGKETDSIVALDSCEIYLKNRFFDYESQYVVILFPTRR